MCSLLAMEPQTGSLTQSSRRASTASREHLQSLLPSASLSLLHQLMVLVIVVPVIFAARNELRSTSVIEWFEAAPTLAMVLEPYVVMSGRGMPGPG
jgi:hypothetical protein